MSLKIKILLSSLVLVIILIILISYWTKDKTYFENANAKQEIGKTIEINRAKFSIEYPLIGIKKIDKQILQIIKKYEEEFLKGENDYAYVMYETYLAPDKNISVVFIKTKEKNSKTISETVDIYKFNLSSKDKLINTYIFTGNYKQAITDYLRNYLKNNKEYKEILKSDYERILNENYNYKYAITNQGLKIYFNRYELCHKNSEVISIDIPYKELKEYMNINIYNKTTKKSIKGSDNYTSHNYREITKTMYVRKKSNLYSDDNQNSHVSMSLKKGDTVKVIAENDEWLKVNYHNKTGYIKSNQLTLKAIAKESYKETNDKVYALSNIDLHESDDIHSKVLGTINVGGSAQRIGTNDRGWSEIIYDNMIAFVYSSYLSLDQVKVKANHSRKIDASKPVVALTFDDGPNPIATPKIIDTLSKYNAVATFFDLGNLMNRYPNIVKAEEKHGNEVESHTFDHVNLNKLSANEIKDNISKSEKAFMNVLGHKPLMVRPPYGNANDLVRSNVPYPLVNWDVDTLDWKSRNKEKILTRLKEVNDYNGKIILMHSIYQSTADAVEILVPELLSRGYQLVTVRELAEYKGVTIKSGEVYYNFNN